MALEFPIELEFINVDFCRGRITGEPGEKSSEQGQEPLMTPGLGFEPGHIGGRRARSPLRHACSPYMGVPLPENKCWDNCSLVTICVLKYHMGVKI